MPFPPAASGLAPGEAALVARATLAASGPREAGEAAMGTGEAGSGRGVTLACMAEATGEEGRPSSLAAARARGRPGGGGGGVISAFGDALGTIGDGLVAAS